MRAVVVRGVPEGDAEVVRPREKTGPGRDRAAQVARAEAEGRDGQPGSAKLDLRVHGRPPLRVGLTGRLIETQRTDPIREPIGPVNWGLVPRSSGDSAG